MAKFTSGAKKTTARMSKVTQPVGVAHVVGYKSQQVTNYEGGTNYTVDPIASLELILASSIFGEPSFYEGNGRTAKTVAAIETALNYDYAATLRLAAKLRSKAWMRLNPQVLVVKAAMHPKRASFTENNPGEFGKVLDEVVRRPDDITGMVEYFIAASGGKGKMPGILKRAAAKRLAEFGSYHIRKYANRGIGLIDVVRIIHANSDAINELMKSGKVEVTETELTWKELRSAGKTWDEILDSGIRLSHSDLLYNLRGIVGEIDAKRAKVVGDMLIKGVANGMIWPVKYYTAYRTIESGPDFNNKNIALQALSKALESRIQVGKIDRKVAVLSDGSQSMTGGWYGNGNIEGMTPAQIAAVSAAITVKQYTDGVLIPFATHARVINVDNTRNVFDLVKDADAQKWGLGGGTDMALAIRQLTNGGKFVDDIYIYSDTQAVPGTEEAITEYRKKVNPKVNVAVIQVTGYDNSVMPQGAYRYANLASWTGKEVDYMLEISDIWDRVESR